MIKKSIFQLVMASFFGGFIALLLFFLLIDTPVSQPKSAQQVPTSFTNYNFDSSAFVVPEGLNFVFASKRATPSVVHIRTQFHTNTSRRSNIIDEWMEEYFGNRNRNREYYNPSGGIGSGVIISADGFIVTNNHVVENAQNIEVLLNDNRTYDAKVIGTDPSTDLAVLKIEEKNLNPLVIADSDEINIGEWVLAIGSPFEFRSTVTAGIVSAKGRNINILRNRSRLQIEAFIQTDAAVNPGNSGGALVNLKGELVGINTAIASTTGAFAGYSFAVPSTLVKKVVKDLIDFGIVQRALLGISIVDLDAKRANEENIEVLKGIYVQDVNENSAAEEAGIEKGDVIVAINDKKVSNVAELQEKVAINRPGDKIKVRYIRNNVEYETTATLKNTNNTTQLIEVNKSYEIPGVVFENVKESLQNKLNIEGGVTISELTDTKWKQLGIKEGYIITKVDKITIRNVEDFSDIIENINDGETVYLSGYYPDGKKVFYGIEW